MFCSCRPSRWAQAETGNIAGVVRDTTGAVMPGVTVEAASPALIEKVRSVVSDGQGLYRIVNLRPGMYTVTFTLPGFGTVKREGIALTTGFTANVNAELKVGSLEETVTVTGEAPVVDVQNVEQQTTLSRDILDAIPTSRRPGAVHHAHRRGRRRSQRLDPPRCRRRWERPRIFRGPRPARRRHDLQLRRHGFESVQRRWSFSTTLHTFEEVVVETAAGSAEATTGGVQINIIPKDGGNIFSGTVSPRSPAPNCSPTI